MARGKKRIDLKKFQVFIIVILVLYILGYIFIPEKMDYLFQFNIYNHNYNIDTVSDIPDYSGYGVITLNSNIPSFTDDDISTKSFEKYSELDIYGRCGVAFANIGIDLMPTTERGSIGSIKPSGWQTIKYDNIDGNYLYNRCHLIAYQLTAENANKKNLITCTRQMNTGPMLEYENKVASYIKETKNHVLYRVTPVFEGNNRLAKGVQIEALSVEDNGKGIKFNIFIYNVQDGIEIDYYNGNSKLIK